MAKKSEPRGQRGARPSRGAGPRNAENAGAKVSMPSLSAGYTQFCIAGLQESSPEETQHAPKLLAAWAHWGGGLQRSPRPPTWLVGDLPPLPENPPPRSVLWASSSPCPRNVDFVPTPLPDGTTSLPWARGCPRVPCHGIHEQIKLIAWDCVVAQTKWINVQI